jgi:urea transporter
LNAFCFSPQGLAYLGCATANFVAKEAKLDEEALDSGLLGYNGVLLGAAFSVFLPMKLPAVAAATVLGAAATPFVYTAIGNSMQFERTRKNTTNYMTTVKVSSCDFQTGITFVALIDKDCCSNLTPDPSVDSRFQCRGSDRFCVHPPP